MTAHKTPLVDLVIWAVFLGGFGVNCLDDAAAIFPINSRTSTEFKSRSSMRTQHFDCNCAYTASSRIHTISKAPVLSIHLFNVCIQIFMTFLLGSQSQNPVFQEQ